ncbi:hypothetical protein C2E21_1555 [Chlorella sorokiniana]|uniref:Aminoacetone oxidase family FAD-binding enzyme n=1 Tax=Chlorella sorokiniana TaxID=3076 RepID=A0A2P6TZH1_CHLSO|nr:hypothetical protein C2E21_1555 [Chlorella sorokiniana]|eukprot:PRW59453.1 hypothetical protein C2E21_1555 [Chlorella sorokiniana]
MLLGAALGAYTDNNWCMALAWFLLPRELYDHLCLHGVLAGRRRRCHVLVLAAGSQQQEIVVVGAGAAGLAAAYFAAVSGAQVKVLEKTEEAGKKVRISGGTRCNVLPSTVELPRDYFTDSSTSALRAVFSTWSLDDCHYWLSNSHEVGIKLALEEATGKWFPASNSGADVRDRLVQACRKLGVQFAFGAGLEDLRQQQGGGGWELLLQGGGREAAQRVILATGGLSYPSLGTTGDGYRLLERHGHSLHTPYAALTPLLGTHPGEAQLSGISLYEAELVAVPSSSSGGSGGGGSGGGGGKKKGGRAKAQRTAMLFTHRGYSGPAILDLSHHVVKALERQQPAPQIRAQWTGDAAADWEARLLEGGPALVPNMLRREGLPQRLAEALCLEAGVPLDRKLAELRKSERAELVAALTQYALPITGHEGYAKAEVTGGGLPLNEVDCGTLESRRLPGVHVCGELLDVFGRIGGFNFYWAFVTGRLAGLSAAEAAAAAPH